MFYIIFFGIPLAILTWFVVSLVCFIRADEESKKGKKISFIAASITLGLLIITVVVLGIMLSMAIRYM